MQKDMFADTLMHPNLALTEGLTQRPVCCMVMENAADAQVRALDVQIVHVYRQGKLCTVLFELPLESGWQAALECRLGALGLTAGMSGPFALAASAHGCMRKAQLALETGARIEPGRVLYPMSEYSEAALVIAAADALALEDFVPEDFCDAAIARMIELDAHAGTQYADSLHAYLSYGLDLRQAAHALNIHRNTLDYRMKRVQELFEFDLTDVNTCFELLFSFWLMDNFPGEAGQKHGEKTYEPAWIQAALWRYMEGGTAPIDDPAAQFTCRLLGVSVNCMADEERTALLRALCALLPQTGSCAFDEDMLLFALPPQEMEVFACACRSECDKVGCHTVVTQTLHTGRLMQHAKLCRMALYAAPQCHISIQEIGSMLFFMVLERRISLSPYLCEDVIRVMDDDAMRGTALSKSLYAYLLNFMDMKRAAALLGIHRNTMEYQMRKIDALIGKTVSQSQRFLMMCTYKMLALPDIYRL